MLPLGRLHDATSRGLFFIAGLALVLAVGLYAFEVIARYVFDAPTTWSGEAVQYALAVMVFGGLPEMTRRGAHVAVDMVPEALGGTLATLLRQFNLAVGTLACTAAGWIEAREAIRQFERGLMTNAANPVPRWWITSVIALGLISAALHFARQMRIRA